MLKSISNNLEEILIDQKKISIVDTSFFSKRMIEYIYSLISSNKKINITNNYRLICEFLGIKSGEDFKLPIRKFKENKKDMGKIINMFNKPKINKEEMNELIYFFINNNLGKYSKRNGISTKKIYDKIENKKNEEVKIYGQTDASIIEFTRKILKKNRFINIISRDHKLLHYIKSLIQNKNSLFERKKDKIKLFSSYNLDKKGFQIKEFIPIWEIYSSDNYNNEDYMKYKNNKSIN